MLRILAIVHMLFGLFRGKCPDLPLSRRSAASALTADTGGDDAAEKHDEDKEKEVGAVEDLMREHGVICRAILVYRQAALARRSIIYLKTGGNVVT
jgi:hypothetical protein